MNINFDTLDRNLKPILLNASTSDLAQLFEENESQRNRIFLLIGISKFSDMFIFLEDDLQVSFFNTLKKSDQTSLLNTLSANDLKTFLRLYKEKERLELFKLVERKNAQAVVKLFSYEEDSAAAVSSPHFISFPDTTTVKQATYNTIANAAENDEIDVIFFHDANNKYVGATTIKDLIAARSTTPISEVIDTQFPYVYEDEKFTKALRVIRDYDLLMLPVLTRDGEMIGFVSETDALNLMADSHENLLRAMVKVAEDDDNLSATSTAFTRLPWLLLSVILNLVIASGLTSFEGLISAFVGLVLFQPMILGMAGNISTQSMGVTILALHQDNMKMKRHIGREFLIGVINSLFSGIVGFGVVYLFLTVLGHDHAFVYGIVVGLSLIIAMIISAAAGVLTPIILKAMKFDEKAASGPLISTINDFFALQSYFLIALMLMNFLIN
ncbi:MAG: magnesium transporter [Bacilli bacterium]|nr:magnesium transporter [Bacilli bacterium]